MNRLIETAQTHGRRAPWGRRLSRVAAISAAAAVCSVWVAGPAEASYDQSSWAVIAISPSTWATGYASDYPTLAAATAAAVGECGVTDCQMIVEVTNGCASLAQASNLALGWSYGASRDVAESGAKTATGRKRAKVLGTICAGIHQ